MKFLFAKKEYMTELFTKNGEVVPVTVLSVPALSLVQKKTDEKDGYSAFQIGIGSRRAKTVAKPQHRNDGTAFETVREVRSTSGEGDPGLDLSVFQEGDIVSVTGISKGKGFQGGVKRHGFSGGRRTHGQKHSEREPGSIGAGGVQRVLKGLRMAGRMGSDRVTVKNLTVAKVDPETRTLFVKGAVPGKKGTLLQVTAL